ncbi:MAG: glycosyltransferase [Sphingomicrobium sp.]
MSRSDLDLAILLFDLTNSGVVLNALRIAQAAAKANVRTEIWLVQAEGMDNPHLPRKIPVRVLCSSIGADYTRFERKKALLAAAPALIDRISHRRPRVLLSPGNHIHPLAVQAVTAETGRRTRLIGRVSNALSRFSWSPGLVVGSVAKRLAARRRLRAMDRLIAVSSELRWDLVTRLALNPSRVSTIPNGVDIRNAERLGKDPVDHPWLGEPTPVVLGIGRLVPQKNFQFLLRAFALARQTIPVRLMLLGSGPQENELRDLARELGVADDVHFAGQVANPFAYLHRSSLFVLPSRWEGMSNALLEALASGCPSIATRCPGSNEILANGRWGRLVSVDDAALLASAMIEMLRNPPPRERQLERARHYDLDTAMRRYLDLIQDEIRKA